MSPTILPFIYNQQLLFLCVWYPFIPIFFISSFPQFLKIFKHFEMFKEFCSEHLFTLILPLALHYLLCHIWNPSLCIDPSICLIWRDPLEKGHLYLTSQTFLDIINISINTLKVSDHTSYFLAWKSIPIGHIWGSKFWKLDDGM